MSLCREIARGREVWMSEKMVVEGREGRWGSQHGSRVFIRVESVCPMRYCG